MAVAEREVTLFAGEQLQVDDVAPSLGQALDQCDAGLVEAIADHHHHVVAGDALPHGYEPLLHRPLAVRLHGVQLQVQAVTLAQAVAGGHQLHAVATNGDKAEGIALSTMVILNRTHQGSVG